MKNHLYRLGLIAKTSLFCFSKKGIRAYKKYEGIYRLLPNVHARRDRNKNVVGEGNCCFAKLPSGITDIKLIINNVRIVGNGNQIVLHATSVQEIETAVRLGLTIDIEGSSNRIDLYLPCQKMEDTHIIMEGDENRVEVGKEAKLCGVLFNASHHASIIIGRNAQIQRGNTFFLAEGVSPNERSVIRLGSGCHIATGNYFRTSYGETICSAETGEPISRPKDIVIGDHVWIMTRCFIFAGTSIQQGSGVAAQSFVNREFTEPNVLIGGTPAKILRRDFHWKPGSYWENQVHVQ